MLPTMHIFGNIDTLESPSTLIDTDAYINNSLPSCADKALQRENVNKDPHLTRTQSETSYLCSCDDLLPNLIQALDKPNTASSV